MNNDHDEFSDRLRATLDRSVDQLDADTIDALQQARAHALSSGIQKRNVRPAMMIAASVVALVVVPWLSLQQQDTKPDIALVDEMPAPDEQDYLSEDPDLLADWAMLDAIGEVPDA